MNPNQIPPSAGNERGPPPTANPQMRPLSRNPSFTMNNPPNAAPPRPVRMEQPRNDNINYQNFYSQQGMRPMGDQMRFQNYGMNNNQPRPMQDEFQRNAGQFGQRGYPGPQPRFPGPQQQQPPRAMNEQNNFQRPLNPQQMNGQRPPGSWTQQNYQRGPEIDNHRQNENQNSVPLLSRKSSNLDLNNRQEYNHQQQGEVSVKPENTTKPVVETPEEESTPSKLEEEISIKTLDTKDSKPSADLTKPKTEKKEPKKDECIVDGTVTKNIKYFEERDTTKLPLIPREMTPKKIERTVSVSSDIVKSEFHSDDYESGVDESPMIHPNLRSIDQAPGKVARIPFPKSKRRKKELKSEKKLKASTGGTHKKVPWRLSYSPISKPNYTQSSCNHGRRKKEVVESFNPEEELLAFFRSSKTARKLRRDANYSSNQNASKDKLEYKPTTNGDIVSPKKTPSKLPGPSKRAPSVSSPTKTPLKSPGTPGSKSLPKTPETPSPPTPIIKKVPMNKIQVGAAPSPNLKAVRSKVGSLVNTTHKPGGGNIKIESHKIDFSKTQPRIAAKNDQYAPSGGDKKIPQVKLQWSAKSKVGSLENATYKPGGGDKKIESVKLDFKEKAKPKVGSKDNVKHVPGGGTVKIENQKLEFKAQSKVGSLDNVKHKPGGGDIKIFDDKTYLKQISGNGSEGRVSGTQSFGDLSVVREVRAVSAPGTPGRKTAVKIKKTTTINGSEPTVKHITEVMVESQTPKKGKKPEKVPSKQEVKLIYSKKSSIELTDDKGSVDVVKVPANDNAPILRPRSSNLDALGSIETENKKSVGFDEEDFKNLRQTSGSSDLLNGKSPNDSGMSKFLKDEMAAHEIVGEMWKERNNGEKMVPREQQQLRGNDSRLYSNVTASNPRQMPPQGIYQPTPFVQSQQQPQVSIQPRGPALMQQQDIRFMTQQQSQNLPK